MITTTEQKIQETYDHVEKFIGDVMSEYDEEDFEEMYKEEVWTLAIDFVNDKGWDTKIAEDVKGMF